MVDNKINDRLGHALEWCRERNIKNRLDLFGQGSKKKPGKGNINKKEFNKMCKKANVKKESLCKTVFTKDI